MSEDICDKLVRFNERKECVSTNLEVEAADEITRLREENARLRGALKPFAKNEYLCLGRNDLDYYYVLISHIRAAAAAIREGETK